MINGDIRKQIFEAELTHKEVARAAGITHEHLSRLLAHDLSDQNRQRILEAIKQAQQSKQAV